MMKEGNAVKPRNTESITPQTNTGSRPHVMPGARSTNTVVTIFSAAIVVETAKIMMVKQNASMPGVNSWTDSGAYPVHPVGNPPRNSVEKKMGMMEKSSQ